MIAEATIFGYYFVPQRLLKQLFLSIYPAGNPEHTFYLNNENSLKITAIEGNKKIIEAMIFFQNSSMFLKLVHLSYHFSTETS